MDYAFVTTTYGSTTVERDVRTSSMDMAIALGVEHSEVMAAIEEMIGQRSLYRIVAEDVYENEEAETDEEAGKQYLVDRETCIKMFRTFNSKIDMFLNYMDSFDEKQFLVDNGFYRGKYFSKLFGFSDEKI